MFLWRKRLVSLFGAPTSALVRFWLTPPPPSVRTSYMDGPFLISTGPGLSFPIFDFEERTLQVSRLQRDAVVKDGE